jgi:hypothetical protein
MKLLRIILSVLMIYLFTYVVLSVCGRYQPIAVGISHVEEYAWAPLGFYDKKHPWVGPVKSPIQATSSWSGFIAVFFYPVWAMEKQYIHRYRSNL